MMSRADKFLGGTSVDPSIDEEAWPPECNDIVDDLAKLVVQFGKDLDELKQRSMPYKQVINTVGMTRYSYTNDFLPEARKYIKNARDRMKAGSD